MQDSAQMVAWIKSDTESAQKRNTTRFHISQDRHLVYVTVARYDQKYLEYLVHGKLSQDDKDNDDKNLSFMIMDQYGPWDTTDRAHMRRLGPLLLAIELPCELRGRANKRRSRRNRRELYSYIPLILKRSVW
ncbi:unnamed protein product [Penicillium nalgiovense]|nr:unnamed protein product [Penicillium nalgiovense]